MNLKYSLSDPEKVALTKEVDVCGSNLALIHHSLLT